MNSASKKIEDVLEEYEKMITIPREIYRIIIQETNTLVTGMRERKREQERERKYPIL